MFYQTALLAGYLYARWLVRRRRPGTQAALHIALLALSLLLLPIGPGISWVPASQAHPAWLIWRMLTASIGLPFALLSASTPLLQSWLSRRGSLAPYWLFALSNFASLAALLAYPTLIEPLAGTQSQSRGWSLLYVLFAVCCGLLAVWRHRHRGMDEPLDETPRGSSSRKYWWFALSACGSMLLLAVTNHIDENVAAVPLLWVLPLAVYLLSFIVTFGSWNIYRPSLWLRLLAFALGTLAYAIYNINAVVALAVSLPIFLGGLFICCVFCHGELHRLRPPAGELADFYLAIALGGAAGAVTIGLVAPALFSGVYELPFAMLATALLALLLKWKESVWPARLLWAAVSCAMILVAISNYQAYHLDALSLRRSFYGSLRTVQTPRAGPEQQRILFHGTIEHGSQFVQLPRRRHATTYYGPDSGVGVVLREGFAGSKQVGIIGLGAGTLAAYGKAGDEFTFYEINRQVADMAEALFFYLRETPARTKVLIGDGRLSLEHAGGPPFNVLVLDAFSGDAIPVHLLTREAMALYRSHLRPDGVIAFHVSNDFLDLAPVVAQLAQAAGFRWVLVHNHGDVDEAILPADWMLVTNNPEVLSNAAIRLRTKSVAKRAGGIWTDDYSDVWDIFRAPKIETSGRLPVGMLTRRAR